MMNKKRDAYGGNGDIYFSEDNLTATKCLRNRSSIEKINRYKREVEVMKGFSQNKIDNIVEVISVDFDEKNPENSKIIMKKYEGNLTDLIEMTRGNVKLTLKLILPIIEALKILSENTPAIYHRDLKPENILYEVVDGEYKLCLTDFGICFLNDDQIRLTDEITAIGARMFTAPEYEVGRVEHVTEKGDIFSIGKIIWWMINGIEKALLPSNFWFIEEFDLVKRFENNTDVIAANVIISACLKIDPNERCTYLQLKEMINNILEEGSAEEDTKRQYLVEVAMEKRRIQYIEKLKFNKQIVNLFSITLLESLDEISKKYPTVSFLHTLKLEYRRKSKDGLNYTSKNVEDDAMHYLYDRHYDDIYIPIHYIPARKGEKYASISVEYFIRSNEKHEKMVIKYNNQGVIVIKYKGTENSISKEGVKSFIEDLIADYLLE